MMTVMTTWVDGLRIMVVVVVCWVEIDGGSYIDWWWWFY